MANRLDLGDLLMRKGWIDRSQLNRALAIQRQIPGRLGTCLLEINAISEDQLLSTLSEQLGAPPAPPEALRSIPQEVIDLVPTSLARRGPAIPFKASGSRLSVAVTEMKDLNLHDELAFAAGKRLDLHIASEARIHEALERYYDEESPVRFARLLDRLNRNRYLWNDDEKAAPTPQTAAKKRRRASRPAGAQPAGNHSLHALYAPKDITLATLEPCPEPPEVTPPVATNGTAAAVDDEATTASETPAPETPGPEAPAPATPAPEPPAQEISAPAVEAVAAEGLLAEQEATEQETAHPGDEPQEVELPEAPSAPPAPSIQLTAEERAALAASEQRHLRTTLHGTLAERLGAAEDRDEIGELLLASLDAHFERSALLIVTADEVRGWKVAGEGARRARFEDLRIDLEEPSAFLNLQHGADFIIGPLADLPAHSRFVTCWLRSPEEENSASWLVPVRLKDRLVNVIYAEGERPDVRTVGGLRALRWFAHEASKAFEDFILRKKSRLSKRAVGV